MEQRKPRTNNGERKPRRNGQRRAPSQRKARVKRVRQRALQGIAGAQTELRKGLGR